MATGSSHKVMSWITLSMIILVLLGALSLAVYAVMAFDCLRDRALSTPLRWVALLPPLAILGAWRQGRRGQVAFWLASCCAYGALRGTLSL